MMEEKSSKNENKEYAVRMLQDQQKVYEVSMKYGRDEVSWSEMWMFLLSTVTFSLFFKISIPKFKFK